MPVYEYKCDNCDSRFEVLQRISDPPLTDCPECEGALRKVLHPVGISFKGSGFYSTDYKSSSARPSANGESAPSENGASEKKSSEKAASKD
ncbi:zinc ribbon domain-containing protein [Rubrobacter taiwanensis]|jgi:putative FmdB family regulatory protein|uniref:Zinc ribbon domain-containing protein n=1 Tax=Rubrobacter taiwanensis TaxID=185139 RepID=A0A4R1BR60_9ACTN|nr:FmdB family zinc ribbon protein [Rubrobacter taiwanensis]TCJ20200.1 zinc ribbon domain-containing protein [Rubrobacter taiwanensis]